MDEIIVTSRYIEEKRAFVKECQDKAKEDRFFLIGDDSSKFVVNDGAILLDEIERLQLELKKIKKRFIALQTKVATAYQDLEDILLDDAEKVA